MSMMTTLSLCVSCEFSRAVFVYTEGPTFFLNRALFRLNPALSMSIVGVSQTLRRWTEGATYIRQGGHHAGHWPTF